MNPLQVNGVNGTDTPAAHGETFCVGVDENGLGPRLGPLVVTAVTARVTPAGTELLGKRPRGGLATRLGDSKRLVSFEDSLLGEAWAQSMARRNGPGGETPAAVVRALALDDDATLRSACPDHHIDQCWRTDGEALVAGAPLMGKIEKDLERLASRGVTVIGARVAIVCAKRLNEATDRGLSRFHVDLHTMERLVSSAVRARPSVLSGAPVYATCGKVGGFDKYGGAFSHFLLHTPLVEGRARSEYAVPGVGTVAFVRDAEERDLLVAMASLVGKWVRDLLMRRVVGYHRERVPDLPEASGYHDPVTTRFIAATALARKQARIQDACFVRRPLPAEAPGGATAAPEATASSAKRSKPRARPERSP